MSMPLSPKEPTVDSIFFITNYLHTTYLPYVLRSYLWINYLERPNNQGHPVRQAKSVNN
jgi:hypothetical protein